MKILELRLRNLNSLYGDWCVDFTNSEYTTNGIFTLTGPTGAGKTTVLDAICLALYGATPRLGRITKTNNEILSRNTADCSAEVVFESQAGRFRCHWAQRRARGKIDGKLQDQEHEIADANTGKLIESKRSKVLSVIEEKTGMDFNRFTRSILLAQGGFDTFLKAGVEEKSKILEQLTGTEIYSDISLLVHQRLGEESKRLDLLQTKVSTEVLMTEEHIAAIQQAMTQHQAQEGAFKSRQEKTVAAVNWLNTLADIEKEIDHIAHQLSENSQQQKAFAAQRLVFERAQQAATLEGSYAGVAAIRQQQEQDQSAVTNHQATLNTLTEKEASHQGILNAAIAQVHHWQEEQQRQQPVWQRVREQDQELRSMANHLANLDQDYHRAEIERDGNNEKLIQLRQQYDKASTELHAVRRYLTDHAQDAWLVGHLAGIEVQLENWHEQEALLSQAQATLQHVDDRLADDNRRLSVALSELDAAEASLAELDAVVSQEQQTYEQLLNGRLPREYRTELQNLTKEKSYQEKIASLEDHRAQLAAGEACPLCGATDHPFANGSIPLTPQIDSEIAHLTEFISRLEHQEAELNRQQSLLQKAKTHQTERVKHHLAAQSQQQLSNEKRTQYLKEVQSIASAIKTIATKLHDQLLPMELGAEFEPDRILPSLRERLQKWQNAENQRAAVETVLLNIDGDIKALSAVVKTQSEKLNQQHEKIKQLAAQHHRLDTERLGLFGDRQPDAEARAVTRRIEQAEADCTRARQQQQQTLHELAKTQGLLDSTTEKIHQRAQLLQSAERQFSVELNTLGFDDEAHWHQALLSARERLTLREQAQALDKQLIELQANLVDRKKRFDQEQRKAISDQSMDQLLATLMTIDQNLSQIRDEISECKHTLERNALAHERHAEVRNEIETQRRECQRWRRLHDLIGSSDGKKFRNFAQGLTFDVMLSHANRRLAKMTDRYLLVRDRQEPLALNVIDNYQAGEIRSSKNLSGGESFIVSLTLALGLSSMSSNQVRVDSLFLDEGFGTLDEGALETALDVLSSLHQEGKLIGVISHIPALKNRIACQVEVTPDHGGKSLLHGPGCRRLD